MPLQGPVKAIAVKRYTDDESRTFAFGLLDTVMNVAALVAGPVTDVVNAQYKGGVMVAGQRLTALRFIFLTGSACSLVVTVVTLLLVREIRYYRSHGRRCRFV